MIRAQVGVGEIWPRFILMPCGLGVRRLWSVSGSLAAPTAVLERQFMASFPRSQVISLPAASVELDCPDDRYYTSLSDYFRPAITALLQSEPDVSDVLIGGDHSVAFPSICAKLRTVAADKLGLILIDSHGELHQPSTSPSGNFHGMWLRALLERFEQEQIEKLCPVKLPASNVLIIGNLHLEQEERDFIAQRGIQLIDEAQFLANRSESAAVLARFCQRFEHLHISLDLDVIKADQVAVNLPEPLGIDRATLLEIIEALPVLSSLSLDLVEINIDQPQAEATILLAQELIKRLMLRRWQCANQEMQVANL